MAAVLHEERKERAGGRWPSRSVLDTSNTSICMTLRVEVQPPVMENRTKRTSISPSTWFWG